MTANKINTTGLTVPTANSLASVSYVKGTVQDVPAKGGSGFSENTNPSVATCPSGTTPIGTGAVTESAGEEVSELQITVKEQAANALFPGSAAIPPNSVFGFIDNFTSNDQPDNYVQAVCTAAHAVSNPSGMAARHR